MHIYVTPPAVTWAAGSRFTSTSSALPIRCSREIMMTPAFAEGLAVYEKQPTSLRLFFPDIVEAIDLTKEEKRLDKVQFVTARSVHTVKSPAPAPAPELTKAEKTLAQAQELSAKRS